MATTAVSAPVYPPDADSLALIGTGFSNTTLFIDLVRQANEIKILAEADGIEIPQKTICLIDRDLQHGTGKAWGIHTSPSMLIDGSAESTDSEFVDWLLNNESIWKPEVNKHEKGALEVWFATNKLFLTNRNYGLMDMPRFIYGMFRKEKLLEAIEAAPSFLHVKLLEGEVTQAEKNSEGKCEIRFNAPPEEVEMRKDANGIVQVMRTGRKREGMDLTADVESVGTGPPPVEDNPNVKGNPNYFGSTTDCHPNPVMPGRNFPEQFKMQVKKRLAESGKKVDIAILGAGRSAQDVINMVTDDKALASAVNITIVANNGMRGIPRINAKMEDMSVTLDKKGIMVHTDKGGHEAFDMVVRCIGFGRLEQDPLLKAGLDSGNYRKSRYGFNHHTGSGVLNGYIVGATLTSDSRHHVISPSATARLLGSQVRAIAANLGGVQFLPPVVQLVGMKAQQGKGSR